MRDSGSDFSAELDVSFAGLQAEVREACANEQPWPRRVIAAVEAAFAYAARESEAARVLTDTGGDLTHGSAVASRLTTTFAKQLREVSGDLSASQGFTEQALVGGVVSLVRKRITLGDAAGLPALAPGAAQFVLVPYLGDEQARRVVLEWVR